MLVTRSAGENKNDECGKNRQTHPVRSHTRVLMFCSSFVEKASIAKGLPLVTDGRGGGSGVRGGNVAGADRSGEVRALGKMLQLSTTLPHRGVATGGGRRPRGESTIPGVYLERPFGVDAHDLRPFEANLTGGVVYDDLAGGDAHGRRPEGKPAHIADQGGQGGIGQHALHPELHGAGGQNAYREQNHHGSDELAAERAQDGFVEHVPIVADVASDGLRVVAAVSPALTLNEDETDRMNRR